MAQVLNKEFAGTGGGWLIPNLEVRHFGKQANGLFSTLER
jgi:hypothetical protein